METIQTILTIFGVFTGIALLAYVDKRYALGLNVGMNADDNWFSCASNNRQSTSSQIDKLAEKDREIKALAERVATLEKLVTDPAEQLKREIDGLR